jgi:predicted nucleic acid-binding protein
VDLYLETAAADVLIDFLNGREPSASRIALELEHGTLATTPVSRFELLVGANGAGQQKLVRALLDAVPALPLDVEGANRAAASQ